MRPQNGLLVFLGKETHSETKSWKSSRISYEESYNNNGKPWKSSRILSVNPKFFIFFLSFFHFFSFFFFSIFHFFHFHCLCSFIFFHFFIFFNFLFIFFHFFIFSFSFSLLGAQNLIFFGPQFRDDFSSQFTCEKSIFGAHRTWLFDKKTTFETYFHFFLLFSPVFFSCFFSFSHFFIFLIF